MRGTTARFIPGEEIGAVSQWQFGSVDTASLLLAAQTKKREDADGKAHDDTLRQESHGRGFAEGFAQGMAQGLARATLEGERKIDDYARDQGQQAADRFACLLENAREQLEQSRQVMAQGVLELACELARQVLRHELSVNPNALQPVIREALGLLAADSKSAVVRLHPLDAEVLQDALQAEFAGLDLALVADASVKPGGCRITSAGTVVDGSLESRWRRAVANLGLDVQWDAPA